MHEMEPIPKDNIKNNNILVEEEDEEPQDTKKIDALDNNQIGNRQTNDIALNIQDLSVPADSNYFITSFRSNLIPNLVLLGALLIIIVLEIIYKNTLFKYSLTYEQNLQESLTKSVIEFFKIISICGNGVLIGIGLFFIFCFFSLVKTVLICAGLILMIYLHDIMKLIYNDPRPFWINTILFQGKCECSYGNPSGHSLIGFYFYLSITYYLCKSYFKHYNNFIKFSIYLFSFLFAALTAFSRLVLGVHSLDQVLYGSFLGIFAFLIFTFTFKIYDMPLNHYLKFYRVKKYINVTIILLNIMLILPFILYSLIDFNKDKKNYEIAMDKKCPNVDEFKFYSKSCLAESLVILLLCGAYFGQFIFWHLISKKKSQLFEENQVNPNFNKNDDYLTLENSVNNWNIHLNKVLKNFMITFKILGVVIIAIIPGIFYILVPGDSTSFGSILIFKIGLPLFLIGLLAFGPCLYGIIYLLKE